MRRLALAAGLAVALLPTALARASVYTDVLHTYQTDGSIPPCQFSSEQLSTALKGIDTYGQQYFADFSSAVQNALAARASGACSPGVRPTAPPARGTSRAESAVLPSSATAPTDSDVPAPIVAMAVLALGAAAVLAVRGLALAGGWEPAWAARWRHAWGEAGYRVGGRWADFADWLRGRR